MMPMSSCWAFFSLLPAFSPTTSQLTFLLTLEGDPAAVLLDQPFYLGAGVAFDLPGDHVGLSVQGSALCGLFIVLFSSSLRAAPAWTALWFVASTVP